MSNPSYVPVGGATLYGIYQDYLWTEHDQGIDQWTELDHAEQDAWNKLAEVVMYVLRE